MTNLSRRVIKANQLKFVDVPGTKNTKGATQGSKGDHYRVTLFQKKEIEEVTIGDQILGAKVFSTCCQILNVSNGSLNPMCECRGNNAHTVCYHSMGYLKSKLAERNQQIYYFESILAALNGLNFGGCLAKITSKQGNGYVWAVIKDKPPVKILSSQENITLMRGKEEEGID